MINSKFMKIRYFIDFYDNLVRDFVDNTDILVVFSLCMKVDGSCLLYTSVPIILPRVQLGSYVRDG